MLLKFGGITGKLRKINTVIYGNGGILRKKQLKLLTMEISRNLNCKQNKKDIDRIERKLDKLKLIENETDEIKQLEGLIKNYYNKKTEAAKIRSRVKWAEEGEKSTRYFFNLEKSAVKKSYGIKIRRQTVVISMTLTR
jgi:hypothetical protein